MFLDKLPPAWVSLHSFHSSCFGWGWLKDGFVKFMETNMQDYCMFYNVLQFWGSWAHMGGFKFSTFDMKLFTFDSTPGSVVAWVSFEEALQKPHQSI